MCGTYTYTVTFTDTCSGTAVLTIDSGNDGLTSGKVVFHETCAGGATCDATFTATASLLGG